MFALPTFPELIGRLLVLAIAGPVHELAHAWVAYRLGDRTSYEYGRLSLNPLDHIDPLGAILILLTGFGWFKPVPVNPYALHRASNARRGMALVSIAGPLSNLLLAAVAALPWRLGLHTSSSFINGIYTEFIFINIILALFNMIPLPPLDGSKVLMGIVPLEWTDTLASIEPYGIYIFFALIAIPMFVPGLNVIGLLIGGPANWLYHILLG